MKLKRLLKHIFTTQREVKLHLTDANLAAIKSAIGTAETHHLGEIRFAVEAALEPAQIMSGMTARERALEVFSELRVWDTEFNSGVLIYVLFADRAVEIIADRGINSKVENCQLWQKIVADMESAFAADKFESGALLGISAIANELIKYFPVKDTNANELPNEVSFL